MTIEKNKTMEQWQDVVLNRAGKVFMCFLYFIIYLSYLLYHSMVEGFDVWWLHYPFTVFNFIFFISPICIIFFRKYKYFVMLLMSCLCGILWIIHFSFLDLVRWDDEEMFRICLEDGGADWDKVQKKCVRIKADEK